MPAALQADVDVTNVARLRLVEEGRHADDWHASRSFAIVRLRGRLPSLHALEGYREAFAEIGAHLVLDANARTQFEPRVIQTSSGPWQMCRERSASSGVVQLKCSL